MIANPASLLARDAGSQHSIYKLNGDKRWAAIENEREDVSSLAAPRLTMCPPSTRPLQPVTTRPAHTTPSPMPVPSAVCGGQEKNKNMNNTRGWGDVSQELSGYAGVGTCVTGVERMEGTYIEVRLVALLVARIFEAHVS